MCYTYFQYPISCRPHHSPALDAFIPSVQALIKLQAHIRGHAIRRVYTSVLSEHRQEQKFKAAVIVVQSIFRARQARKDFQVQKTARAFERIPLLQALVRGYVSGGPVPPGVK